MKKRCKLNKQGYFFIIDSILALAVLVIGGFLIFSSYVKVPVKEDATALAESMMDFFSNTKIKDLNNAYAGLGGELWQQGKITNAENTLLQQLGEFYAKEDLVTAESFIAAITQNSIPPEYLFEFRINNGVLYPRSPSPGYSQSKAATKVLIPSKKIVYGVLNRETGDLFGPYGAEVMVWQAA